MPLSSILLRRPSLVELPPAVDVDFDELSARHGLDGAIAPLPDTGSSTPRAPSATTSSCRTTGSTMIDVLRFFVDAPTGWRALGRPVRGRA